MASYSLSSFQHCLPPTVTSKSSWTSGTFTSSSAMLSSFNSWRSSSSSTPGLTSSRRVQSLGFCRLVCYCSMFAVVFDECVVVVVVFVVLMSCCCCCCYFYCYCCCFDVVLVLLFLLLLLFWCRVGAVIFIIVIIIIIVVVVVVVLMSSCGHVISPFKNSFAIVPP